MIIRYEEPGDNPKIRRVNEETFETREESDLVDALREEGAHVISLVAVKDERIIGHILFTQVIIKSRRTCYLALGLA
jgi:putative acetyltransferase